MPAGTDDAAAPVTAAEQEPATRVVDDEIAARVGDVVKAALSAGSAVARSVARATGDPDADMGPSDKALAEFVRVGADAVSGIVRLVVADVGKGIRPETHPAAAEPGPATARPTVRAGSNLRLPLIVENRGGSALPETGFVCTDGQRLSGAPGPAPTSQDVRFSPDVLAVAAHDFEKLTVVVAVSPDVCAGSYRARIAALVGDFVTDIDFDVAAT